MDKQFEQLTKLAKKYDEESNFKQADEITELMIKIAQSRMPLPQKPTQQKGVLESLGSAMGQGFQYLGSGIGSAAKSVGSAAKSVGSAASQVGNVIAKPFKNIARANETINSMPAYQAKMKQRYEVDSAVKTILDRTYNEASANQFTREEARQKAKRLGEIEKSNNAQLEIYSKTNYNMSFSNYLDIQFETYLKDQIPLFYPPK